ncbi:hypothetical protein PENTCL1PPCAC_4773, partial [Pristionchus entomophagus]
DDTLRKFPVNSRAHVQRQWMERLGLSEAETQEKLNHYRQRNEQGGDIRWCSIHFNSPIGLPIELRQNPAAALQSRELRLDLQMDRLNDRYRNPTVASTPDVSDNDMDEAGLETPPRLSPSRPSTSRPIGADLEYHDDELYTGMAKRFITMSSIRTNTTIDKGSEYVPSEESGGDTEESDSEETSENGKRERKYRIVGNEQLLELFRRCISVKTKRVHPWRAEILSECERVREDIEETRLMARIGMPSDLVFDELVTWEANRDGGMGEYEENDEEEGE